MGQASSQPQRESAERPNRRASASLRRALRERSLVTGHDGLQDGLLTGQRSQPDHTRTGSNTSRLSNLFRHADSSSSGSNVEPDPEQPRGAALLHRTRSRFQEMLRRDSVHVSRPSFVQHRASLVRSGQNGHLGEYFPPPRLPSIDLTSTFDNETFTRRSESEPTSRNEGPPRRSNMRFNPLRPDRPFRHLTSSLRRRRSPPASASSMRPRSNEDQAAMLSRLLSVAAAATAATLMGDDHNALNEARSLTGSTGLGDLGGNGEDGSFDGFLRALQNGRIASALRQGGADTDGENASPTAPLNFFRMFRFGSSGTNGQNPRNSTIPPGSNDPANPESRMVPIIIVGIRSISPNSNSNSGSPGEELPPFIDALGNFPSPLPTHALGAHGHESIDAILRPPQNGTSFRHRRRASMGGFGMGRNRLSGRMDDQRDQRSPDRRRDRPWSVASSSSNLEPRPPPATPASLSPELSRIPSRNSTPSQSRPTSVVANSVRDFNNDSRRNSMLRRASAASPLSSHTEETASIHSAHSATNLLGDSDHYRVHRRSDTAPNIHYPRFASGHPRRNGVVEPDNLPPLSRASMSSETEGNGSNSNEGRNGNNDSRSWIIYVLGGSYPENHPILTTPSLFTENPTYEDMMLLSALLGPAKAPVATEEDIESAGGVYIIRETIPMESDASESDVNAYDVRATKTAKLVAVAVQGEEQVLLAAGQCCLVCLSDFAPAELVRKLIRCQHVFHQECIDQWLTTGRNSCPLCREQGVDEKASEAGSGEASASGSVENDAVAPANEVPELDSS